VDATLCDPPHRRPFCIHSGRREITAATSRLVPFSFLFLFFFFFFFFAYHPLYSAHAFRIISQDNHLVIAWSSPVGIRSRIGAPLSGRADLRKHDLDNQ
jgi:hypothetical protein